MPSAAEGSACRDCPSCRLRPAWNDDWSWSASATVNVSGRRQVARRRVDVFGHAVDDGIADDGGIVGALDREGNDLGGAVDRGRP